MPLMPVPGAGYLNFVCVDVGVNKVTRANYFFGRYSETVEHGWLSHTGFFGFLPHALTKLLICVMA